MRIEHRRMIYFVPLFLIVCISLFVNVYVKLKQPGLIKDGMVGLPLISDIKDEKVRFVVRASYMIMLGVTVLILFRIVLRLMI